jgi:hypothetical protein
MSPLAAIPDPQSGDSDVEELQIFAEEYGRLLYDLGSSDEK